MSDFIDPERALERFLEDEWHGSSTVVVSSVDASGLAHASLVVRRRADRRVFTTSWLAARTESRRAAFARLLTQLFDAGVFSRDVLRVYDLAVTVVEAADASARTGSP